MENKLNAVDGQLTIVDAEGNEKLCQILFTLDSEEFGKKYVVFYPIEQLEGEDDEEQIQLMAASYTEGENGEGELSEIETDEEWSLIEDAVADFEESMSEDECECGHCHHEEGHCHHEEGQCHHEEHCCCEEEEDNDEHHGCCCKHHE